MKILIRIGNGFSILCSCLIRLPDQNREWSSILCSCLISWVARKRARHHGSRFGSAWKRDSDLILFWKRGGSVREEKTEARGWLLIAEVKSRFDSNTGGADPKKFTKAVCYLGFTSVAKDFSNKMFILFYFKKKEEQNSKKKDIDWPELKPCLYKRR